MRIAVGICAYNECKNISQLLTNVLYQQENNGILKHVYVVSSGSTDGTNQIVDSFSKKDSRVRLIEEPIRRGKFSAINEILNQCRNNVDVIVFISADTIPCRHSIERVVLDLQKSPRIGAVCGRPVPTNPDHGLVNLMGKVSWDIHHIMLEEQLLHYGKVAHLGGEFSAIREGIIEKIPPVVIDEPYMGVEIVSKGYDIIYDPRISVKMLAPSNFKDYIKQRLRSHVGHRQLLKQFRYHESNVNKIASNPSLLITILRRLTKKYEKVLYALVLTVFTEGTLFTVSRFLRIDDYICWGKVESTKASLSKT